MVIDRHTSQDPTIRIVLTRQALKRSRTSHSFDGGVQPQGHVDPWICRRPPSRSLHRPHLGVKRAKIQGFDKVPHSSRRVIHGKEALQVQGAQFHLGSIGYHQARQTFRLRGLDTYRRFGDREQCVCHAPQYLMNARPLEPISGISSQPLSQITQPPAPSSSLEPGVAGANETPEDLTCGAIRQCSRSGSLSARRRVPWRPQSEVVYSSCTVPA